MPMGPKSSAGVLGAGRYSALTNKFAGAPRVPSHRFSILFASPEDRTDNDPPPAPAFFVDLNCDQIVGAVTAGRDEYDLKPFFYDCLKPVDAIAYRHEVMRDLENESLRQRINVFAAEMRDVREHIGRAANAHYAEQRQGWFLDAVDLYCIALQSLSDALDTPDLRSRGFRGLRDYLAGYLHSLSFVLLESEAKRLKADLAKIEYDVLIKGTSFTVRSYQGETDYSADVEETFAKFKQNPVKDYKVKFSNNLEINHIEATILEFVAKLHAEVFESLRAFCEARADFIDHAIAFFDREVQFYLAYLDYIAILRRAGLPFCYPEVSGSSKEVFVRDGFDVALARKLASQNGSVVCNDFHLQGRERILVVSGPNQGGKTTFARMFGQLHYLASLGFPVPGRKAKLFLFDHLFTHFEREERVEDLRGKLEDDLMRIHAIFRQATSRSIIVMNEIFTSTTIVDETLLSKKIMAWLVELGGLGVWVTFVDELAAFGPQTVSMTSTVVAENPALRTFRLVRRPADGLAYAMAIAQKYRLTYEAIKERIVR
jgi:DNA mismatch repair protein MutS